VIDWTFVRRNKSVTLKCELLSKEIKRTVQQVIKPEFYNMDRNKRKNSNNNEGISVTPASKSKSSDQTRPIQNNSKSTPPPIEQQHQNRRNDLPQPGTSQNLATTTRRRANGVSEDAQASTSTNTVDNTLSPSPSATRVETGQISSNQAAFAVNETEDLPEYSVEELVEKKIHSKKTFLFGNRLMGYTPRLHFWKSPRRFKFYPPKDNGSVFCLICLNS
jgi:hypothetical protein